MKCGACKISVRAGCSYDVTNLRCPITMTVNGFYDECDVTARQKLIYLLSGKKSCHTIRCRPRRRLAVIKWCFVQ